MSRKYPDIDFFDIDPESLIAELIALFEEMTGRTLYPADPVRAFIVAVAGILVQTVESFNQAAKQNVPRYAEGTFLDSLAELYPIDERMDAKAAATTLRCTIDPQDVIVTVPEGTRAATVDGGVVFATTQAAAIPAGKTYVDVAAVCEITGAGGNGYAAGQICKIVGDSFTGFVSIENITESEGGSDAEDDDAYYERMRQSNESLSTAGPSGAYAYWAMTASALITDAKATSPSPGEVVVIILLQDGELPGEEMLREVDGILSAEDVRPLTDKVTVKAPEVVGFDVDLTYWLPAGSSTPADVLQEDIETAVNDYILWQRSKIGRDINPSKLHAMVMEAGAKRVEVRAPVFVQVDDESVAQMAGSGPTVINGGAEDE